MTKNGQLKAYALELKDDLGLKYSAEGKTMPRELSEAPVALSPRNQKSVADQLKQSLEQRESILTNGRIEQLQSENEMLKEQLKVG